MMNLQKAHTTMHLSNLVVMLVMLIPFILIITLIGLFVVVLNLITGVKMRFMKNMS